MVGVARGHQMADTLKPYSQKTSQSSHTRTTALSNSMKLSHARGATQDWRVMVERSDRMWSTGEGDGKPLQYSCLENHMNSMKRQNDRVLKEELPRSVGFIIKYIQLFVTLWGVEHQAFLLFTISWSLLKLLSIELVINPTSSFSITHFSCPWSFPASGSFPMSWLFSSRGQSIGASASASVLLIDIQGWFPLGWLIWSHYCPRDSQESSPAPQFKNISSSALNLLYVPTLISVHDFWKNHRCDKTDLYQQSDISALLYTV